MQKRKVKLADHTGWGEQLESTHVHKREVNEMKKALN